MTAYIHGIDISRYQYDEGLTHKFDFKKAKAKGAKFCGIRATVGDYYTDATLERNVKGAQDAGLVPMPYTVPAYHDGSVKPRVIQPEIAVQRYLDAVGKYDIDPDANVLDLEIIRGTYAQTRAHWKQFAKALVKHTASLTWYTRKTIADPVMTLDAAFWRKWWNWHANYTAAAQPVIATFVDTWHCWQYSSTGFGKDYGAYSTNIDRNWMKPEMFAAITNQAIPQPVPEPTPIPVPEMPQILNEIIINGVKYTGEMKR